MTVLGKFWIRSDFIPVIFIAAMTGTVLAWNSVAQLSFTPPLIVLLVPAAAAFVIFVVYTFARPNRFFAEFAFYSALWLVMPIVGVQLSYLAAALNYPLRDGFLTYLDALLGFHWASWFGFAAQSRAFLWLQVVGYFSYFVQPYLAILLFARDGPRGRNAVFTTAALIALLVTIAISAVVPAFGPTRALNIPSGWESILTNLRNHHPVALQYTGIISFPSFHAVIGMLLIVIHWDIAKRFSIFLILNSLMLFSIPLIGQHYLVDVIAGAFLAVISLFAARVVIGSKPCVRASGESGQEKPQVPAGAITP
jgi:membrane-associated phospholipid phosphatase